MDSEKKFKLTVYIERGTAIALKHKAVDLGKPVSEVVQEIFNNALKG